MLFRRGLAQQALAGVVLVVALLVLLVVVGVLSPADTGGLRRYLQPFAGLIGTERVVVLVVAVVLILLAGSTIIGHGAGFRRRW